jgi:cholesterol transport system auxiliary component
MKLKLTQRVTTALAAVIGCAMLASCAVLGSKTATPLYTYTLDGSPSSPADVKTAGTLPVMTGHVLLVETPQAVSGYDSTRMVYSRLALTQEAFANSAWVDTPGRMLAPMMVEQLRQSGQFRAVLLAPSAAKATLSLNTTILHLQQDFLQVPSRVRFSVQVTLLDVATREVLASHTIDVVGDAASDDAAGGAQAAHAAVREGLQQVAALLRGDLAAMRAR